MDFFLLPNSILSLSKFLYPIAQYFLHTCQSIIYTGPSVLITILSCLMAAFYSRMVFINLCSFAETSTLVHITADNYMAEISTDKTARILWFAAFTLTTLPFPGCSLFMSIISLLFTIEIFYKITHDHGGLSNTFHMVFNPPHDFFAPIHLRDELSKITFKPFQIALSVIEPDETILFVLQNKSRFHAPLLTSLSFWYLSIGTSVTAFGITFVMVDMFGSIPICYFFMILVFGMAVPYILSQYFSQSGLVVTNRNFFILNYSLERQSLVVQQMSIDDTSVNISLDANSDECDRFLNRVHTVGFVPNPYSSLESSKSWCYIHQDKLPSLIDVLSSLNFSGKPRLSRLIFCSPQLKPGVILGILVVPVLGWVVSVILKLMYVQLAFMLVVAEIFQFMWLFLFLCGKGTQYVKETLETGSDVGLE